SAFHNFSKTGNTGIHQIADHHGSKSVEGARFISERFHENLPPQCAAIMRDEKKEEGGDDQPVSCSGNRIPDLLPLFCPDVFYRKPDKENAEAEKEKVLKYGNNRLLH